MSNKKTQELTIIMVEDDEGHAKLIEKNLRRSGLTNEIIHINDGSKAMDFFFESRHPAKLGPLLVLLDLNLPEIDGYEVLQRLKSNPKTHKIPIIILTTTDNPKEVETCYQLGCNIYLTKPIEYETFAESIRKLGLMLAIAKVPEVE